MYWWLLVKLVKLEGVAADGAGIAPGRRRKE